MMKLTLQLLITLLGLPLGVAAQSVDGLYAGGSAGANFLGSMRSVGGAVQLDNLAGPVGLVDLGWGFGDGLRAEVEASDRSNVIANIVTRRINGSLMPVSNVEGRLNTPALLANLSYDLPKSILDLPVQPYIGAGAGYAWLQFDNVRGQEAVRLFLPQGNIYNGPATLSYGKAGAFAYQAIGGLSVPFDFLPGLAGTLDYRFFGTARADVAVTALGANRILFNGAFPLGRARRGFETHSNALMMGFRYGIGG
jgi:opacity protein-like surface antigen